MSHQLKLLLYIPCGLWQVASLFRQYLFSADLVRQGVSSGQAVIACELLLPVLQVHVWLFAQIHLPVDFL